MGKSDDPNAKQTLRQILRDGDLGRLVRETVPRHRNTYALALLAMLLAAGTTALSALLLGEIVDVMTLPEKRALAWPVAGAVFLVFLFRGFSTLAQQILLAKAGNRIVADAQNALYQKLLAQGEVFFTRQGSSDLVMRITASASRARSVIESILTGVARDLVTIIGLLAVMFYQQPVLSLIAILCGPPIFLGVQAILSNLKGYARQQLDGMSAIIKVLQETASGYRVVKSFTLEPAMYDRMRAATRYVEKRNNRVERLKATTIPLVDSIAGLTIAAIVVLSASDFMGVQSTSPGQLLSFVVAFLMMYDPARKLAQVRVGIEHGLVGVRMMYAILDEPVTIAEAPDAAPLAKPQGEITLDGVDFNYSDTARLFSDMHLTFAAGKMSALVGPSGGGKSSILSLILRLYDPMRGAVRIGGQDIRDVTFRSLRDSIGYIGQDTFLFAASIHDNIALARPGATRDDVIAAARVANAHDFISALPQGYDTPVAEGGSSLSGGQRQRIAIARAVLKRAPILLMDEATSALDGHSEALVQEALDVATSGCTTIVVAHRLSTILHADCIYYLEDGKVVEQGSARELLDRGGKFRALYDTQRLEE